MHSIRVAQHTRQNSGLAVTARAVAVLGALAMAALGPSPSHARRAEPVPQEGHGNLAPTSILVDSTWYLYNFEPGCTAGRDPSVVFDIDVENGILFAAAGNHLEIYDGFTNPGTPPRVARLCRPRLVPATFPDSDTDFYYFFLDAPAGDSSIVLASIGTGGMGVVALKTTNPASPQVIYQHEGFAASGVATVQSGGRAYGLVNAGGIKVYDLTTAKQLTAPCLEPSQGCNVFKGTLPGVGGFPRIRSAGSFLATAGSAGVMVWDLGNVPAALASTPRMIGNVSGLPRGFEIWIDAGTLYAAVGASGDRLRIYDFPCQSSGSCAPRQLAEYSVPGALPSGAAITASSDGASQWLYVGRGDIGASGQQAEYVFKIDDPTDAEEITPPPFGTGPRDAYWGWYYKSNGGFDGVAPMGGEVNAGYLYRNANALLDVHEIRLDQPPVTSFDLPSGTVYAGQSIVFDDNSSNQPNQWCWGWDMNGDGTASFTMPPVCSGEVAPQQNPSWIPPLVGPYPRTYAITLQACNDSGCGSQVTKNLVVNDPTPKVTSVTANGQSTGIDAFPCETVQFAGQGVGGRPPLTLGWEVLASQGAPAPVPGECSSTTETLNCKIPSSASANQTYNARLTVSNGAPGSPVQATSPTVTVKQAPALAFGNPAITYDQPVQNGVVQFHVQDAGAISWEWDFDTATATPAPIVYTVPAQGHNPVHSYPPSAAEETYTARVTIRNCAGQQQQQDIRVVVPEFLELSIDDFHASLLCASFGCQAFPGVEITFAYTVDGNPTSLEFDWDGNGTFDHTGVTPCTPAVGTTACSGTIKHTYPLNQTANVTPVMKAVRGTDFEQFTHLYGPLLFGSAGGGGGGTGGGGTGGGGTGGGGTGGGGTGGGGTGGGGTGGLTARFTTSPAQPAAGSPVSFDGSTSSGTPSIYSWTFGDGATGSTVGPTTTHTYANPGTYTVALEIGKQGSCGAFNFCTATATKVLQVGTGGPALTPSGDLGADFTFEPAAPKADESVTFTADAEGNPTGYRWNFGEGAGFTPASASPTVDHAFAEAGLYNVQLEVSKSDQSCTGGVCKLTVAKLVNVEPKPRDGTCVDSDTTLCLLNGRFEVTILWETDDPDAPGTPLTGEAHVVPGQTDETGLFWFFDPGNWEVMGKLLEGCDFNGHYWVFAASTTDVGFTLNVTDTKTGLVKTYVNPAGTAAPAITDIEAFPVCEAP